MSDPIVDFVAVKTFLDLEKNEADYPIIADIRQSVHDALENHTGRFLAEVDKHITLAYDEGPTKFIGLAALPVWVVESFTIGGVDVDPSQYRVDPYGIRLLASVSEADIAITYRGGFSEIPGDIYRAELMQIVHEYQNKDHVGASSVTTEGGSIQRPPLSLLSETKRLLSRYVHVDRLI